MRFATVDGRAAIVSDSGFVDIATESDGKYSSDVMSVLEDWSSFTMWARAQSVLGWQPLDPARLGAPVPNPRQVFALAINYIDHAAEAAFEPPEFPYVFTKFPSCITGPFDDIRLPSGRVDWEVELVVVIGVRAEKVSRDAAWSYVAGLTIGQDISERRVQFRKPIPHLSMAKSFPTFGPTGPWLVTLDELPVPDDLAIRCLVNDEEMQSARTSDLIFGVADLIEAISAAVTLLPGDLVFTGTPAGVGSMRNPRIYLSPGDVITSEIDGIGAIRNTCVAS